jgi:flagellar biosynthesis protein FlhG
MTQQPSSAANSAVAGTGAAVRAQNILAVASGKGGVGKTWFSITLAHGLARMGTRTLLFDADLGLANVDIQLGLMPQRDLGGVLGGRLALSQAKVRYEDGNFDIIAGRSGSGSLATLPAHRLQALGDDLVKLSDSYDHIVMDLGAGIDRTVRSLSARAGTILVVTTAEPTSLTDAYAFIKVTHQTNPNCDARVVVNCADTPAEGRRTFDTLCKACRNFLGFEPQLAGIIRRDKRVIDAIRAQIPLLTRSPSSAAANDVEAIVDRLITTM